MSYARLSRQRLGFAPLGCDPMPAPTTRRAAALGLFALAAVLLLADLAPSAKLGPYPSLGSKCGVFPKPGDEVGARSYILYYWGRDELSTVLSGERRDVLRAAGGRLLLARRTVYLDHTALPIPNLSMVL